MISLKHLKACSSVLEMSEIDYRKTLKFITDTRKYKHPSAFVAIPGAKVNPLDLIDELLKQECPLVVYQDSKENEEKIRHFKQLFPKTNFVSVKDSVIFLQELTHAHIVDWKKISSEKIVFAISGSNGKTTHKEMLTHILKSVIPGKVVSTEKNNNNHLGVPLTLLDVTSETDFVVLELGSNHPGEIKVLCDIAVPNAGITTNIGATHMEFFGTEEKVFEEEAYLYYSVKDNTNGLGFFLINKDDQYLKKLSETTGTVCYGENPSSAAKVAFLNNGAEINYQGKNLIVQNTHITGKHNKLNLITCVFIANHFFPDLKAEIISAAAEFRPTKNRSEWIMVDGREIYLDAYNANPSSMKAALKGFMEVIAQKGNKPSESCVVLGDMNELGENAPRYHEEVGKFVKDLGFENIYFVGRYADFYLKGHPQGKTRTSSAEFKSEYRSDCLKKYPIHFIKGSRSLQLESLFDIT